MSDHTRHMATVAARSATVKAQEAAAQSASLSPGLPAGGLDRFLEEHFSVSNVPVSTPDEVLRDESYQDHQHDLLDNPATNGQDADFERSAFDRANEQDRRAHLNGLSITDLRKYSKGSGIPGAYGLKKADLVEAIISKGWFAS
jgi:hypothetical protein